MWLKGFGKNLIWGNIINKIGKTGPLWSPFFFFGHKSSSFASISIEGNEQIQLICLKKCNIYHHFCTFSPPYFWQFLDHFPYIMIALDCAASVSLRISTGRKYVINHNNIWALYQIILCRTFCPPVHFMPQVQKIEAHLDTFGDLKTTAFSAEHDVPQRCDTLTSFLWSTQIGCTNTKSSVRGKSSSIQCRRGNTTIPWQYFFNSKQAGIGGCWLVFEGKKTSICTIAQLSTFTIAQKTFFAVTWVPRTLNRTEVDNLPQNATRPEPWCWKLSHTGKQSGQDQDFCVSLRYLFSG